MDHVGNSYISSIDLREIRRYSKGDVEGTTVAAGHKRGSSLSQTAWTHLHLRRQRLFCVRFGLSKPSSDEMGVGRDRRDYCGR